MNDVAYLEAARVFAAARDERGRCDAHANGLPMRFAWPRRASRKPAESAILLDAFARNLETFKAKPDAARKYVSSGEYPRDERLDVSELAAYTTVTSLILNLNETVMKE